MEQVLRNPVAWVTNAVFYSIYPLGMLGAPAANDFRSSPVNRLQRLQQWIPHIKNLGCDALYLGPVFESDFHGYDTADYFTVDRRLGDNQELIELSDRLHDQGIKLILDGVFNHVGRNFFAFKDLQAKGERSIYRDWFCALDFNRQSSYGDHFYYEGWYDAYNLVKLNVRNPEVSDYILSVVSYWIDEFKIDGIRLDVAEIIDQGFLTALSDFCRARKADIWLMGEVINGDYNEWANERMLNSVTNYEAYKSIYSSHNDRNYYEIAWTLNRQFGEHGLYRNRLLYNFVDNHDCTRIASILHEPDHLFLVYTLLFTAPGIPSMYYGSEWAIPGIKGAHEDTRLRPVVDTLPDLMHCTLYQYLKQLIKIRRSSKVLLNGGYRQLFVSHSQLAFERHLDNESMVVALNLNGESATIEFACGKELLLFQDQLDQNYKVQTNQDNSLIINIPANSARILKIITYY